jgi:hypothetical protein
MRYGILTSYRPTALDFFLVIFLARFSVEMALD